MEKITGNEPIVPCHLRQTGPEQYDTRVATPTDLADRSIGHYILSNKGLTIRQHFAAMAMQGLLSNSEIAEATNYNNTSDFYNGYAKSAVSMADALINELNK